MSKKNNTSIFISLILRHKPETIGISLDEHGWADVQDLIAGINASGRHHLDMERLEEIVRTDEKQRYSFNEDHTLIRANQGHSIPVDVELEEKIPPVLLYHGTGEKYARAQRTAGFLCRQRRCGRRRFLSPPVGDTVANHQSHPQKNGRIGDCRTFRLSCARLRCWRECRYFRACCHQSQDRLWNEQYRQNCRNDP